jgi:uncharacterized protein (UPF0261 family)
MLDTVAVLHRSPALRQPDILEEVRPAQIIEAKSVAHSIVSKDTLSVLAAKWITGRVLYRPTIGLACTAFGVSRPRVTEVMTRMEAAPFSMPLGLLALGWLKASPAEEDAFVRANLTSIWDAIERVTA